MESASKVASVGSSPGLGAVFTQDWSTASAPSDLGNPSLPSGEIGHRIRLRRLIGEGAFARVYAATQSLGPVERDVALRVPKSAESSQAWAEESELLAQLNHPGVVRIYNYIESFEYFGGLPAQVLEFLEGPSLHALRHSASGILSPLPGPAVVRIGTRICEASHAVHQLRDNDGNPLGAVHRDLSPDNLLLDSFGEPRLIDFGTARTHANRSLTGLERVKGKAEFMAPERRVGQPVDRRADIYSIARVLASLLTDSGEPNPEEVSGPLGQVLLLCQHKDARRRPSTALELARKLGEAEQSMSVLQWRGWLESFSRENVTFASEEAEKIQVSESDLHGPTSWDLEPLETDLFSAPGFQDLPAPAESHAAWDLERSETDIYSTPEPEDLAGPIDTHASWDLEPSETDLCSRPELRNIIAQLTGSKQAVVSQAPRALIGRSHSSLDKRLSEIGISESRMELVPMAELTSSSHSSLFLGRDKAGPNPRWWLWKRVNSSHDSQPAWAETFVAEIEQLRRNPNPFLARPVAAWRSSEGLEVAFSHRLDSRSLDSLILASRPEPDWIRTQLLHLAGIVCARGLRAWRSYLSGGMPVPFYMSHSVVDMDGEAWLWGLASATSGELGDPHPSEAARLLEVLRAAGRFLNTESEALASLSDHSTFEDIDRVLSDSVYVASQEFLSALMKRSFG